MPSPKTTAETSISIRIPRAVHADLAALQGEIASAPPTGLARPSVADLCLAAILAGLPAVRKAYGVAEPTTATGKRAKKG